MSSLGWARGWCVLMKTRGPAVARLPNAVHKSCRLGFLPSVTGVKEVPGQSGSEWNSGGPSWDRMERGSLATEPQARQRWVMATQCPDSGRSGGPPEPSAHFGQSWACAASDCCGQRPQVRRTKSPDCPERVPVKALAARQLPALTGVRVL